MIYSNTYLSNQSKHTDESKYWKDYVSCCIWIVTKENKNYIGNLIACKNGMLTVEICMGNTNSIYDIPEKCISDGWVVSEWSKRI